MDIQLSVALETENIVVKMMSWLKRQKRKSGNGEERAQCQNGKTAKRRKGETGNGKRTGRRGQPS